MSFGRRKRALSHVHDLPYWTTTRTTQQGQRAYIKWQSHCAKRAACRAKASLVHQPSGAASLPRVPPARRKSCAAARKR
eukprot:2895785-Prymnesium_polylepis.1